MTATLAPLDHPFNEDGFAHTLVERRGDWALFSKSKPNTTVSFEVVRIRVSPACEMFGKSYPDREVYPHPGKWGTDGFTYPNIEAARAALDAK